MSKSTNNHGNTKNIETKTGQTKPITIEYTSSNFNTKNYARFSGDNIIINENTNYVKDNMQNILKTEHRLAVSEGSRYFPMQYHPTYGVQDLLTSTKSSTDSTEKSDNSIVDYSRYSFINRNSASTTNQILKNQCIKSEINKNSLNPDTSNSINEMQSFKNSIKKSLTQKKSSAKSNASISKNIEKRQSTSTSSSQSQNAKTLSSTPPTKQLLSPTTTTNTHNRRLYSGTSENSGGSQSSINRDRGRQSQSSIANQDLTNEKSVNDTNTHNNYLNNNNSNTTSSNIKDNEKCKAQQIENSSIKIFLSNRTCYDLIPTSSKLVVFDTTLPVKTAFYSLVANGLRAAPLWSSTHQKFVGMLTITDFIMVLRKFYKKVVQESESPNSNNSEEINNKTNIKMTELEEHTIQSWRELMNKQYSSFISIDPECTLYDGLFQLIKHKIHRLPIIDFYTGNPLYILTHKRILKFIKVCMDTNTYDQDDQETMNISWFAIPTLNKTLHEKKIGTYNTEKKKVFKIYEDEPIIAALNLFADFRVSALPVIERKTDKLVDVYSKFDVINLAAERCYNQLDVSIKQALSYRQRQGRPHKELTTCTLNQTIGEIAKRVVEAEVHRIIVIDDAEKVIGIVSLSDLLCAMVM